MNPEPPVLRIEAGHSERHYWADLLRYRELFFFLAWRDILVRYKQTVVGVAWSVLRPLLTMLIFVFVFGKIAQLPSNGVPYPILVFSALLPWQFFANALSESSSSMIVNSNMVSKIYFPRIIIPSSSVVVACVDFLISFVLLAGLMLVVQFAPTPTFFAIPLFTLLAFIAALGPGLLVSALNVRFRDFRYIVPFVVQMGLYLSPVGYSSAVIAEKYGETARLIYSINPMVGVIDGFRWCVCGEAAAPLYWPAVILSVVVSSTLLTLGILYFRKTEKSFADVI